MRSPQRGSRIPGAAGAASSLLLVAVLLLPPDLRGQVGDARDRAVYLTTMATYFQVSPVELEILLEGRGAMDELPVLLLLSRDTGMSPAALSASRRGGATWMSLLRRFGLDAAHLHVELGEGEVDARVERAWRLYRSTDRGAWGRIELTDEEIITLIHLNVLSRHFRVTPGQVLGVRREVGSWVEVPRRLGR